MTNTDGLNECLAKNKKADDYTSALGIGTAGAALIAILLWRQSREMDQLGILQITFLMAAIGLIVGRAGAAVNRNIARRKFERFQNKKLTANQVRSMCNWFDAGQLESIARKFPGGDSDAINTNLHRMGVCDCARLRKIARER